MRSRASTVRALPAAAILLTALFSPAVLHAADGKLPVVQGKEAVATVNGEPIALSEYVRQFGMIHEGAGGEGQLARRDPAELLDRMIGVRLVVQEAENIGLDTLPEVKKVIAAYEEETLKGLLFGERARTVVKGDPKEVTRIYKESVKEIKLASILLDNEEDAKSLRAAIDEAKDFAGPVTAKLAGGTAKGSATASVFKAAELSPEVARVVSEMKAGGVSPVIPVGNKFTILKVEAIRFPENAEKRAEAEKEALNRKRAAELRKYVNSLQKTYVKQNDAVVKALDFEAEVPGFEALRSDERPVAWIQGESPVTVREVAEGLQKIFFHGIDQAIEQKRVNSKKEQVLEQMLMKRVVLKEAKRKKLDRSPMFKERVAEYRREVLFGVFVQRVIDPEARADDEELKAFLAEHSADYMVEEKVRLELLAFTSKGDAEETIGKLRDGADLQWIRANAAGQADPSAAKAVLDLNGKTLPVSELPADLRNAVAGSDKGSLRLHSGADGLFYVIAVRELVPSRPEEFENVRAQLAQRVFNEKRVKALETWMGNLKKASKVVVHARGKQLRRLLETRAW